MIKATAEQKAETEDMTLQLRQSTRDQLEATAKRFKTNVTTLINLILSNTLNQNTCYLQLPRYEAGGTTRLHIQVPSKMKQTISREADAFGVTDNRFTETLLNNVLSQL